MKTTIYRLSSSLAFILALFAAQPAWAKDNWWTGATDNNWNNIGNWNSSGDGNDNRKFGGTESDGESKFHDLFKNTYDYTVNFTRPESTDWKVHIRSGTEEHPIVFEASDASNGLKVGNTTSSNNTGYYIGYDYSTDNQAWLKLKRGTWDTNTGGRWQVGNENSSTGHLIVCDGATVKCSKDFYVYQGSVDVEGGTIIEVNSNQMTRVYAAGSITLNGGTLITRHIEDASNSFIVFNGGTLKANNTYDNNGGLIQNRASVRVTGGGTIDNGGHNIKIGAALGVSGDTRGLKFTGGGTTRLDGAVNYSGATSVAPGTILAVANGTAKNNILANGLVVAGVPTADQTVFTSTSAFADADLQKVSCSLAPTTTFKFSDEGKTNIVVDVVGPQLDNYWTGAAGDNNLNTPGNWSGNVVPGAEHNVGINVDSETTLTCDTAFSVNSITFPATSAKVTITGDGSITNATTIVNNASSRHVIGVPVEFKSGDDYAQINVTGEVDFQGGVKGTLPANHSKFYGNYTLTANEWTLTSAITLAENATVTASDLEITISTQDSKYLCAEAGASLCLKKIKTTQKGDIFGTYSGDLQAKNITIDTGGSNSSSFKFGENFTGTLTVGELRNYPGTGSVYAFPRVKDIVFDGSNGASNNGLRSRRGGFCLGAIDGSSSGDEFIMRSSANWIFQVENGNDYSFFIKLSAAHVGIDTSDYAGAGTGHTVTFVNNGNNHGANGKAKLLEGDGSSDLSLFGNGRVNFQNTANFTGGLIASNSVTLAVNKDVYPGKGNVMFKDTATFSLVDSASGTVPVAGTLTMAGGTTIHIPTYIVGVLPLSVNALAFDSVTDVSKVVLNIESGNLETGYYPIIGSTTALPEGAADNFELSLGEGVVRPENTSASLCVEGNVIYLLVGDGQGLRSGVWSGRGGDNNFSNPANWENITVPVAGEALDFSGVTANITINCDIDAAFGAVTLPTATAQVTITNGTLRIASMTVTADSKNFSVASGSKLIVDGDVTLNSSSSTFLYIVFENYGEVEIRGKVKVTGSAKGYACYNCSESATIAVKGIECNNNSDGDHMKLNAYKKEAPMVNWIVGEGGLGGTGSKYYWIDRGDGNNKKGTGAELKASQNFTIERPIAARQVLTLDTADGKTITVNGAICMGPEGNTVNTLTVKGNGSVKICNTTTASGQGAFTGDVVVTNTATLAINAEKRVTTGTIIVNTNATLQVAQSGTVALGGDLTLKAGAALGFNYTTANVPLLDPNGKAVTFDEGETTNVVVKISSADGVRPGSGQMVLTSGGKFKGVKVSKGDGAPTWVKSVDVNDDGNIYVEVKPKGLMIMVY